MDQEEWWWIYVTKSPKNTSGYAGKLTDDDVSELYELING